MTEVLIERGDKVQYIGYLNTNYISDTKRGTSPVGKKGTVISDPYQLSAVPHTFFVDVEWFYEETNKEGWLNPQKGHVVNVKNLMVI